MVVIACGRKPYKTEEDQLGERKQKLGSEEANTVAAPGVRVPRG